MHRIALAFAAALTLAAPASLTSAAAADEWHVGPAPSDHPDLRAATIVNDDGHALYVWELIDDENRQIYCEMHLAEGMRFAGEMPVYAIDGGAEVDTADILAAGEAEDALWGHVGERVAFWLLSPMPGAAGDPLDAWLEGRQLEVSFRAADGTERTTRFTLEGSAEAIRGATGR